MAKGKPAAEGAPAHPETAAAPALTRDDLIAASRGVHEDGCAHNGEEG